MKTLEEAVRAIKETVFNNSQEGRAGCNAFKCYWDAHPAALLSDEREAAAVPSPVTPDLRVERAKCVYAPLSVVDV